MTEPRSEVLRYVRERFPGASVTPLLGDASTRSFWRLHTASDPTHVLMDYGKPFEGETDDLRLERIFRRAGLPTARILDLAPSPGCLLLEDLGDRSLAMALQESGSQQAPPPLIQAAVELASRIAQEGTPVLAGSERSGGPALDRDRLRYEMRFFLDHYVRGLLGLADVPDSLREELEALADRAARGSHLVLCHRDFHSRNLMVRPDGSLAMVDIQDARWGPDTYDLASLLRDAYIEVEETWVEPLLERYLSGLDPRPPAGEFRERFHWVSVQRMIKALGTFGYLHGVGRGTRYLEGIPRTLRRLRQVLHELHGARALAAALEASRILTPPELPRG